RCVRLHSAVSHLKLDPLAYDDSSSPSRLPSHGTCRLTNTCSSMNRQQGHRLREASLSACVVGWFPRCLFRCTERQPNRRASPSTSKSGRRTGVWESQGPPVEPDFEDTSLGSRVCQEHQW